MGQIILGAAGAIVGGIVGGPGGAQIGYALGSGIGALAFGPKSKTQRVTQPLIDLKVTGTDYGQPIPWLLGRQRLAGQLWWNTDRRPIRSVARSGGGGKGTSSTPETETESIVYEIDALYGFTCNQGYACTKVFDNGKLIWSLSGESETGDLTASEETLRWRRMTFYSGADDQLPDPVYEAAMTAEGKLAPAYRQRVTIFIEGLQLGSSGAMRNLTFEILERGEEAILTSFVFDMAPSPSFEILHDGDRYLWIPEGTSTKRMHIFDTLTRTFIGTLSQMDRHIPPIEALSYSYDGGETYNGVNGGFWNMLPVPELDVVFVHMQGTIERDFPEDDLGIGSTFAYKLSTREFMYDAAQLLGIVNLQIRILGCDYRRKRLLVVRDGPLGHTNAGFFIYACDDEGRPTRQIAKVTFDLYAPLDQPSIGRFIADEDGQFWCMSGSHVTPGLPEGFTKICIDAAVESGWRAVPIDAGADGYINPVGSRAWAYDESRNCAYYFSADRSWLKRIDFATEVLTRVNPVSFGHNSADDDFMGSSPGEGINEEPSIYYDATEDKIIVMLGGPTLLQGSLHWGKIDATSGLFDRVFRHAYGGHFGFLGGLAYRPGVTWGPSGHEGGGNFGVGELRDGLIGNCLTYAEAQAAIFERCGLTPDQYDVTDLASISREVCSFPWSDVSPGREPTERLMTSGYYELTVSDKIYCRVRGGAPVATIEYEELGATDGSQDPGDPLDITLQSDDELAAKTALTYSNLSNDYQDDTQESDRLISAREGTVNQVGLAMGLYPSEAKAIANTMTKDAVIALVTSKISVLGHHAAIEPTDVTLVKGPNEETYRFRWMHKDDSFPLIGADLVLDDANVLDEVGITDLDYANSTTVNGPVDSIMELLDIALLRDIDEGPGPYVAAKGTGIPYVGTAIYKSSNDVDFEREATVNESAIIGTTRSALGDWSGPPILDTKSSVLVNVGRAVLTSTTRQLLLDTRVNMFLIGDEIIQAKDAVLHEVLDDGSNVYRLTNLLRGCRGTEWAMTGHEASERAVGLTMAGLRRLTTPNTDIGVERFYKAVTLGRTLSSADSVAFTNRAISLKPFSPVDLRVSRDVAGNVTLSAQRRSRFSVRMIGEAGINVPLAEETESYEWDIYNPSSVNEVVRTLTSSTPEVTYTTAQQLADGLVLFDPVHAGVFQMSATVGRGYELRGIV